MTTTQAAAALGVNESRVCQLIRGGTLPATQFGARAITILESARKSIDLEEAGAEEWGSYNLLDNAIIHMFDLPGFGAFDIQFAHEDEEICLLPQ